LSYSKNKKGGQIFWDTVYISHSGVTAFPCLWREHIINLAIGVSQPLFLECGTTFHSDYGGLDSPSTSSDYL